MAADCAALMDRLGHHHYGVVGHDRGGLVALRIALDFPARVQRLAILDALPVVEHLDRCDACFAAARWHWFFFLQPDKPDRQHEIADREAGNLVRCPMLCLWSSRDDLADLHGDPRAIWAKWATDLRGAPIDCGHHMAEEAPDELASALGDFFGQARPVPPESRHP